MPDTTPTPAPVPDPALVQRAAQALHAAGGPFANADPETLAAAVLAELAPELADRRARVEQAEELLSIAHDTSNRSEAERAAAVRRAEQAEAAIDRVRERCQQVRDRVGPGGMINASQILGLLSPTWPDGNYVAADTPKEPTT